MNFFNTQRYIDNLEAVVEKQYDYRRVADYGGWGPWQQSFRSRLAEISGLQQLRRMTAQLPLEPQLEREDSFATYTQQKWRIQTEPGVHIPFYLLLPRQGNGPFPLVLTPHGHNRRGKEVYIGDYETEEERRESLEGERDIALQAVNAGFAAIAMDVRGFWEMGRVEEYDKKWGNSCNELQRRAYMYGRTLLGERVHDMGRLIDYVATRPEIDTARVAITGNSGGGAASLFAAALDERIKVSVPGSFFCTFMDSLLNVPHCLCNFIPGMMQLGEMYDVVGLIAPRPVLMVNGATDPLFPIDATKASFAHVQAIYAAMGQPDRCRLYIGDGGHRYYKAPVWEFIREHLGKLA